MDDQHLEIEAAVRETVAGVYRGDLEAIRKWSVPHPRLAILASKPCPSEQRSELEEALDQMQVNVVGGTPQRVVVHAYFRGLLMPVTVLKTADGWRADLRWWIAARRGATEAEQAARVFMAALMTCDMDLMAKVALRMEGLDALMTSHPPGGEMAQLLHVAENLPAIELEPGEMIPIPQGQQRPTRAEECTGQWRTVLVTYESMEIPLRAKKVEGQWKIDPVLFLVLVFNGRSIEPS